MKKKIVAMCATVAIAAIAVGGTLAWFTDTTDEVANTFTVGNIDIELDEGKLSPDGLTIDESANRVTSNTEYKMIPGFTLEKDPIVTVKGGSEDCWLFVKVVETGGVVMPAGASGATSFDDFIDYGIDLNNWTKLEGSSDSDGNKTSVWYCKATDVTADRKIKVLGYGEGEGFVPNQILVKNTVTKEMMDALDAAYAAAREDAIDAGKTDEEAEGAASSVLPNLTFTAYAVQLHETNGVEFTAAEAWGIANPQP